MPAIIAVDDLPTIIVYSPEAMTAQLGELLVEAHAAMSRAEIAVAGEPLPEVPATATAAVKEAA